MKEFLRVKALSLTPTMQSKVLSAVKTIFPTYKVSMNEYGYVSCIKNTTVDPESFEIHWLELFLLVFPTMATMSPTDAKYMYEAFYSIGADLNITVIESKFDAFIDRVERYMIYRISKMK